ncbi:phosphoglycerate kinase [Candidatus Woesearchaeota archaeon]|nr:phosphoglycerate kinase [Candidatus Woesearchaeota archaeon]
MTKRGGFFTIDDIDFNNKIVLLRVDYNVPLDNKGKIVDDTRIKKTLPTIKLLLRKGAKQIIIISHLGRPKSKKESKYSLKKVATRLQILIKKPVKFEKATLKDRILMLENLRFNKGEEKNDKQFAKKLAKMADLYVNDAFSNSHRKHASMCAITNYLPGCAGLLLKNEIEVMQNAIDKPKRPFVAIVGGGKINTKLPLMKTMVKKADKVLVGSSIAQALKKKKSIKNKKILFPVDFIEKDSKYYDIGPKTIKGFTNIIMKAKTICWNGPVGWYEKKEYEKGTKAIAKAIAVATKKNKAISIAGGGETGEAIKRFKLTNKFTHVSTGGGASLMLWQGKELPAIKALKQSYRKFKNKF